MRSWRVFNDARSAPIQARIGKTRVRPLAISIFFVFGALTVGAAWVWFPLAVPIAITGLYTVTRFARSLNRLDPTERLSELTQLRLLWHSRIQWKRNFHVPQNVDNVVRNY